MIDYAREEEDEQPEVGSGRVRRILDLIDRILSGRGRSLPKEEEEEAEPPRKGR